MNSFRFDTAPQAWSAVSSRAVADAGSSGADLAQLASDVVALARADARGAADLLRDVQSSMPGAREAGFFDDVAHGFGHDELPGLGRRDGGNAVLDLLERFGGAGTQQLVRDARANIEGRGQSGTTEWSWAGAAHALKTTHATAAARAASPDTERVKDAFKQEFAAKAANKQEFDAFMRQVYGDKYDQGKAEQYRQMALRGDFSFLPDVKFVDAATLQGGKGAYNEAEGVVYINRDLATSDPALAQQVFVEEAGAHLDAKLNTSDTRGDEGEMFRRALAGEQLSANEIAAIRNDDDHGTITVDGKKVEVEFWFGEDIVDAASDAVDAVGDAASDVVDAVGDAARDVVYEVGDAIKEVGMGVINAAQMVMEGVFRDIIAGTFMNLMQGRVADAWDSILRGVDKAVIGAGRRLVNAGLEAAGHVMKITSHLLPDKVGGNLMREFVDRGMDSVRSIVNGAIDFARNTWRLPFEVAIGAMQDVSRSLKAFARGDIGGGFENLGLVFVNAGKEVVGTVVDDAMIVAQAGGNVVGNVFGLHEPARGLSNDERAYLKSIYGDAINLEDIRVHKGNISHDLGAKAAHTVGNDIYLPDDCFGPDGALNEKGKATLAHEAFHVYQAQHGGNDYIHSALETQVEAIADSGNRNNGYDFAEVLRSGKPFSEWNPEQQAEFFETIAKAKSMRFGPDNDRDGRPDQSYDTNNDGRIDRAEFEFAYRDKNNDGQLDANGDGMTDQGDRAAPAWSDADFARAMAIWDTLKSDRPDRTLV